VAAGDLIDLRVVSASAGQLVGLPAA
jgi:hypothetical protein